MWLTILWPHAACGHCTSYFSTSECCCRGGCCPPAKGAEEACWLACIRFAKLCAKAPRSGACIGGAVWGWERSISVEASIGVSQPVQVTRTVRPANSLPTSKMSLVLQIGHSTCIRIAAPYKLEARHTTKETTVYFVLEHTPRDCSALSAAGQLSFERIYLEVEGQQVKTTGCQSTEYSSTSKTNVDAKQI